MLPVSLFGACFCAEEFASIPASFLDACFKSGVCTVGLSTCFYVARHKQTAQRDTRTDSRSWKEEGDSRSSMLRPGSVRVGNPPAAALRHSPPEAALPVPQLPPYWRSENFGSSACHCSALLRSVTALSTFCATRSVLETLAKREALCFVPSSRALPPSCLFSKSARGA